MKTQEHGTRGVNLVGVCVLATMLFHGCKKETPPPPPAELPPAPVAAPAAAPAVAPATGAKLAVVKVTNAGVITLNGKTMTLDAFKAVLGDAATKPTGIQYSREHPDQDPTPEAAPVVHALLQSIVDSKIPVSKGN